VQFKIIHDNITGTTQSDDKLFKTQHSFLSTNLHVSALPQMTWFINSFTCYVSV